MSKNNLSLDLLNAITQVNDEYLRDDSILFQDDSANKEQIFKAAARFSAKRKKVRRCIVPECTAPSIVRSHSIQKLSLECIADARHVLAPTAVHKSGRVEMSALGINKASVFPGFCSRHEGMFRQFESIGRIETPSDITLQIYRSVCREIVRIQMQSEAMREILGDYIEFRRSQLERLMKKRVPGEEFSLTSVRSSDLREADATRGLAGVELNLAAFHDDF